MLVAIAAADLASATPPGEASASGAVQVVRDYYAAVSRYDFRRAYAIWHGKQGYRRFRHGYSRTVQATVTPIPPFRTEGAAGSVYIVIPLKVDALLTSGVRQHFVGSYTLPGSMACPASQPHSAAGISKVPV
jgi:hypothetical protein